MVIILDLNNILLSLSITVFLNLLYAYLVYKTIPLLTDYISAFKKSIKQSFIPLFVITLLAVSISLWIFLVVPIVLLTIFIIIKLKNHRRKTNLNVLKKQLFIPVIENWVLHQQVMQIRNYSIYLSKNRNVLSATIYLYVLSGLDYDQVRDLEQMLPPNTVIRINNLEKKTKVTHSYNLAEE